MAPTPMIKRLLDFLSGERGRLLYDCAPKWWLGGACLDGD
jgi:hypothetical protein